MTNIKELYKVIPERESKRFAIKHKVATEEDVKFCKLRSAINGHPAEYYDFEPGTYVRLIDKEQAFDRIIMSNTPMEIRTNWEIINKATGNVLIAGLGLGIVLLHIQDNPKVKSITVIEKYKELVDLIKPLLSLNNKVKIIRGDIFKWLPKGKSKYDTIYFDIWNNVSGDNYEDTKVLHKRFRKYLNKKSNPESWMNSWRREDFRRLNKEH